MLPSIHRSPEQTSEVKGYHYTLLRCGWHPRQAFPKCICVSHFSLSSLWAQTALATSYTVKHFYLPLVPQLANFKGTLWPPWAFWGPKLLSKIRESVNHWRNKALSLVHGPNSSISVLTFPQKATKLSLRPLLESRVSTPHSFLMKAVLPLVLKTRVQKERACADPTLIVSIANFDLHLLTSGDV